VEARLEKGVRMTESSLIKIRRIHSAEAKLCRAMLRSMGGSNSSSIRLRKIKSAAANLMPTRGIETDLATILSSDSRGSRVNSPVVIPQQVTESPEKDPSEVMPMDMRDLALDLPESQTSPTESAERGLAREDKPEEGDSEGKKSCCFKRHRNHESEESSAMVTTKYQDNFMEQKPSERVFGPIMELPSEELSRTISPITTKLCASKSPERISRQAVKSPDTLSGSAIVSSNEDLSSMLSPVTTPFRGNYSDTKSPEKSSVSTARFYDSKPPNKTPRYESLSRGGRLRYDSPSPEERSRYGSPAPKERPRYHSPAPEERPRYDSPAREERSRYDSPTPEERRRYDSPAPEERSRYDSPAPEERSRYDSPAPEERPRYDSPAPEERPGYHSPAPEERSRYDSPAPEERPRYDSPAPEERSRYDSPAPEERPRYDSSAPEERSRCHSPAPEERSRYGSPSPEERSRYDSPTLEQRSRYESMSSTRYDSDETAPSQEKISPPETRSSKIDESLTMSIEAPQPQAQSSEISPNRQTLERDKTKEREQSCDKSQTVNRQEAKKSSKVELALRRFLNIKKRKKITSTKSAGVDEHETKLWMKKPPKRKSREPRASKTKASEAKMSADKLLKKKGKKLSKAMETGQAKNCSSEKKPSKVESALRKLLTVKPSKAGSSSNDKSSTGKRKKKASKNKLKSREENVLTLNATEEINEEWLLAQALDKLPAEEIPPELPAAKGKGKSKKKSEKAGSLMSQIQAGWKKYKGRNKIQPYGDAA